MWAADNQPPAMIKYFCVVDGENPLLYTLIITGVYIAGYLSFAIF